MKANCFVLMIICFGHLVDAQNLHDAQWLMCGPRSFNGDDPLREKLKLGMFIDFRADTIKLREQILDRETDKVFSNLYVSISNSDGELDFYGNGNKLFSGISESILLNGDSLHYPGYNFRYFYGTSFPYSQHSLVLPDDQVGVYHYFFNNMSKPTADGTHTESISHIIIDMASNSGLGAVISKDTIHHNDSLMNGGLMAVKHANNKDWWIVTKRKFNTELFLMLFSVEEDRVLQKKIYKDDILDFTIENNGSEGQKSTFTFSPQGDQLAISDFAYGLLLFDFDRATGELTRGRELDVPFIYDLKNLIYGCAFSPDGSKLYFTNQLHLVQIETEKDNLYEGIDTLANYLDPGVIGFNLMSLAPDCRIYVQNGFTSNINLILYPNLDGEACGFKTGIELNFLGNNMCFYPNYRLGTGEPYCDSTKALPPQWTTTSVTDVVVRHNWHVYPNPVSDELNLIGQGIERYELYSTEGRLLLSSPYQKQIDLKVLTMGLYFIKLFDHSGQSVSFKLLKKD